MGDLTDCLACGDGAFPVARRGEYGIYRCLACGMEHTRPFPTDRTLRTFYAEYQDVRAGEDVVRSNARRNLRTLTGLIGLEPSDPILDFGCGANRFVAVCREEGYGRSYGYDPFVPAGADPLRVCDPDGDPWRLVTLWGVLEHLPEPAQALEGLARRQPPGGWLALTTIDREAAIPYQYKPPEHLCYFTRASLERLAVRAGYRLERHDPYRMVQSADLYLSILLRTMPEAYRRQVHHTLPRLVEVPTNEAFILLRRQG